MGTAEPHRSSGILVMGAARAALAMALAVVGVAVSAGEGLSQLKLSRAQGLLPGLEWMELMESGQPPMVALRVDPRQFRFRVMHFRAQGLGEPLTAWQWLEMSQATAVFNAGQYYPDFSYMGLLMGGGKTMGGRPHKLFQALFMAEPIHDGAPLARIADLSQDSVDPARPGYQEVAQSFMLLDRQGAIRVKRTSNSAQRTIVAEESGGWILVLVTQGSCTLWDLAVRLREGPLQILQAMSMDGGEESQLAVKTPGFLFPPAVAQTQGMGFSRRPLPTVIAIFPRSPYQEATLGK